MIGAPHPNFDLVYMVNKTEVWMLTVDVALQVLIRWGPRNDNFADKMKYRVCRCKTESEAKQYVADAIVSAEARDGFYRQYPLYEEPIVEKVINKKKKKPAAKKEEKVIEPTIRPPRKITL